MAGEPIGSRELARRLGLEHTRVNRLLKTLAYLGIARQAPDRRYVSGPAMHVLAAQAMFGSGLIRRAIGPLESLGSFGLSVALGVLWRDQVSYLYHAAPGMSVSEAMGRVGLFPATRSSIGMVLLSRLPVDGVRVLYRDKAIPNFDSLDALLDELLRVRKQGYALVTPLPKQSTRTLAVAMEDRSAAIAMSGEIETKRVDELARVLKTIAGEIVQRA